MLKIIDKNLMNALTTKAENSDRLRTHYNLHDNLEEPIHRLCIAAAPDTYMRPHRHQNKWELLIILRGKATVIIFDDNGKVQNKIQLSHENNSVLEISKGIWHVFYSESSETILMEVKAGPYVPITSEDTASWAPEEGNSKTFEMLNFYRSCKKGEKKHEKPL